MGVFLALLELGLERGDERIEIADVVDERADVAAGDGGFLLDVHRALAQASEDDGKNHGERGRPWS